MKARELKQSIEDVLDAYDGFSDKAVRIYWDMLDTIDEGYVEGIDPSDVRLCNNRKQIHIRCSDGTVIVQTDIRGEIRVSAYEDRPYLMHRQPSPYERTRATVYATGNKWAIENFNATHY